MNHEDFPPGHIEIVGIDEPVEIRSYTVTQPVEAEPERDLPSLLRRARAHVKATVDRAPNRTAYEAACVLLVEIDEALKA